MKLPKDLANRKALRLDGSEGPSSKYIDVLGLGALLIGLPAITISMWVAVKDLDKENKLFGLSFDKNPGDTTMAQLKLTSSGRIELGLRSQESDGFQTAATGLNTIDDKKFHHIVAYCHIGNKAFKFYVDGVEAAVSTGGNPTFGQSVFTGALGDSDAIGTGISLSDNLDGFLHDVSVFDRTLSQDEVELLYNDGNPPRLYGHDAFGDAILWHRYGIGPFIGRALDYTGSNSGALLMNIDHKDFKRVNPAGF